MSDMDATSHNARIQDRIIKLEAVEIRKKTRNLNGNDVVQVGLFARTDLLRPLKQGTIIMAERAIISFSEGKQIQHDSSKIEEDDDDDIDEFRKFLRNMSSEQRKIFNLLPIAPEFQNGGGGDDEDLGRWWTNRFLLKANGKDSDPTKCYEEVYQHCSAIDHSCFNANARAILLGDETIHIRAERDIHAGEEILIHYDYDEFHDKRTGRRNKASESIHSDLWINRGFYCEDCVFDGGNNGSRRKQGKISKPVLPDLRRKVLQAVSPTAQSRRKS